MWIPEHRAWCWKIPNWQPTTEPVLTWRPASPGLKGWVVFAPNKETKAGELNTAPVKTWSRALWLLFQLASLPMQGSDLLWVCACLLSHSLVSSSLQPHGLYAQTGFSVYGIFLAIIPEWVTISFSRGSSQPKDWTRISCIGRWILYHWATWEAMNASAAAAKLLQSCPALPLL